MLLDELTARYPVCLMRMDDDDCSAQLDRVQPKEEIATKNTKRHKKNYLATDETRIEHGKKEISSIKFETNLKK